MSKAILPLQLKQRSSLCVYHRAFWLLNKQKSNKMHINSFKITTPTCFGPNGPSSGCHRHRTPNVNLSVQCTVIVYVGEWGPCISWLKMSNVKIVMGHVLSSAVYAPTYIHTARNTRPSLTYINNDSTLNGQIYIWCSVSVNTLRMAR
jgi:hypothetical protein